jgi:hypothetical protein
MTRFVIEFDWNEAGVVSLDPGNRLVFPSVPDGPGLYRFRITGADPRPGLYIGEASDLRRRMQHYRTPGPSQATNIRVNRLLVAAISAGDRVAVDTVTVASSANGGSPLSPLALDRRHARLIAEQVAIAEAVGEVPSVDPEERAVRARLLDRPGVGEADYE